MKKIILFILLFIFVAGLFSIFRPAFAANSINCNIPLVAGKIIKRDGVSLSVAGVPGTRLKVEAKVFGQVCKATVYVGGVVVGDCKKGNWIFAPVAKVGSYAVAIVGGCAPCSNCDY